MQQTSSAPDFLTIVPAAEAERRPAPQCGCAVADAAAAPADAGGDPSVEGLDVAGVDPAVRDRNLKRLRRIEGQVRGLQKMIEEDRYCSDILMQVSSVHEALRAVGRELMRNHVRYCASVAERSGAAEPISDDIIEMIYRAAR